MGRPELVRTTTPELKVVPSARTPRELRSPKPRIVGDGFRGAASADGRRLTNRSKNSHNFSNRFLITCEANARTIFELIFYLGLLVNFMSCMCNCRFPPTRTVIIDFHGIFSDYHDKHRIPGFPSDENAKKRYLQVEWNVAAFCVSFECVFSGLLLFVCEMIQKQITKRCIHSNTQKSRFSLSFVLFVCLFVCFPSLRVQLRCDGGGFVVL